MSVVVDNVYLCGIPIRRRRQRQQQQQQQQQNA